MKFGLYIKDKLGIIAGYAGFVILTYLLMMAFHSQLQMRIMFVVVAVIFVVSVIAFDYLRKYKFYNSLVGHLDELDQKYLILDTLDEPDFYEGKLVYSAMYDINKSMTENVRKIQGQRGEFQGFYRDLGSRDKASDSQSGAHVPQQQGCDPEKICGSGRKA